MITQNGEIEITPDTGYDGVKKVTANVNVSGSAPSKTMPSWFTDSENSIPPNGVQCVGFNEHADEVFIKTGDGERTLKSLFVTPGYSTIRIEKAICSYGDSIVISLNAIV